MQRTARFCLLLAIGSTLIQGTVGRAQIALTVVGQTNDGGYADDIAVRANYAYLANFSAGLRVYDVTDPAHPLGVGQTNDGGNAFGLVLSGDYLFLANDFDGLRIYNVSDAVRPVLVGHATNLPSCHATSVALYGHFACVANVAGGLRICDVSDPKNPTVVCPSTPVDGGQFYGPFGVAVGGHYLLAACSLGGLKVYDLSDPANPVMVSQWTNGLGAARSVAVAGSYGFLANGMDGLRIFDLSDPSNPIDVGHASVDKPYSQAWSVRLAGGYAWVGNDTDGLHVYDVTVPANPVQVGGINVGMVRACAVADNQVDLANDTGGLVICSIGFTNPPQLKISADLASCIVSWPAPSPGFVLQGNSALDNAGWVTITNLPVVIAGQNEVTLSRSAASGFYRLKWVP